MHVSQKTHYALRSLVELASCHEQGPLSVTDIASRQNIPLRFLETILNQLKQAGFVVSRRGSQGGYLLAQAPNQLTVGEVMRFIGGPLGPVACADDSSSQSCGLDGNCALSGMWKRVHEALSEIYDGTTLANLVTDSRRTPPARMDGNQR